MLPGDVNDDGVVNTTDGVILLRNDTPASAYQQFYDMNGDGAVNTADFTLYRPRIGTVLPGLSPQLAAGGEGPGNSTMLSAGQVAPVLRLAIQEWALAGLPAQDLARLQRVSVQITDLPAGYLGETAIDGTTIYLSADAAGYGWFVGTTSGRSTEPTPSAASPGAGTSSTATPVGHEDLLTVVMHELGHALGLGDLDPARSPADLMTETLATGVRRLPSARDVATVIQSQTFGPMTARQASPVHAMPGTEGKEVLVISHSALLPAGRAEGRQIPRSPASTRSTALDLLARRHPAIKTLRSHRQA